MPTAVQAERRLTPPPLPSGTVTIRTPPPPAPAEGAGSLLMSALPMLGGLGSVAFVVVSQPNITGYLSAGLFLVASVAFVVANLLRQRTLRHEKASGQRREYQRHLAQVRAGIRAAAEAQRNALQWVHPDPRHLILLAAEGTRVWERRPHDVDFLHVRYGVAHGTPALTIELSETTPGEPLDPVCVVALHRLVGTHRQQPELPVAADLGAFRHIRITGPSARSVARSIVASAVALHSRHALTVAVVGADLSEWDWLKWLPHAQRNCADGSRDPGSLAAPSLVDLLPLLPDHHRRGLSALAIEPPALPSELDSAFAANEDRGGKAPFGHLLLLVDALAGPAASLSTAVSRADVTILELAHDDASETEHHLEKHRLCDERTLAIDIVGEGAGHGPVSVTACANGQEPRAAVADQLTLAEAVALARQLARKDAAPERTAPSMGIARDLFALLRLTSHRLGPTGSWRLPSHGERLRVPIGIGAEGEDVHLDLKESAQGGMGPHGLLVGATGSGKSELLRTLVLGLALTHSPESLNFVLVDFKGGATFAGMARLPHTSAVITNLADEVPLVDRMRDALTGEMTRRQELLRAAGNYASVADYENARVTGGSLSPLPSLLIVVDEFSELLSTRPELIELFISIGRLGRSLGLHLLLASQRLEEGRLRGLDAHLSYRIGLRTFTAAESRIVLGVPDAAELAAVPGMGYLKSDQASLTSFRAAYVSGPAPSRQPRARGLSPRRVLPFTLRPATAADCLTRDSPDTTARPGVTAGCDAQPFLPRQREDGHRSPAGRHVEPPSAEARAPSGAPTAEHAVSLLDLAVDRLAAYGPHAHPVWLPPLDAPATLDQLMPDLDVDVELGLVSRGWRAAGDLTVPLGLVDRPLVQRRDVYLVDLTGAGGHSAVVGGPRSGKSTALRSLVAALSLTRTPREIQFYLLDFGGGALAAFAKLPHVAGIGTRAEPEVVRRVVAELRSLLDARESFFRRSGIEGMDSYRAKRSEGHVDDGYGDVFLVIDGWGTLRQEFDLLELEVAEIAQRGLAFGVHLLTTASRWTDYRPVVRDLLGTRVELRLGDPLDSEVDRRLAQDVPAERPGRGLLTTREHVLTALPRVDGSISGADLQEGVSALVDRVSAAWQKPPAPRLRLLPPLVDRADVLALRPRVAHVGETGEDVELVVGIDEAHLAPVTLAVRMDPHVLAFGDGGAGKSTFLRTCVKEIVRSFTADQAQLVVVDYRRSLLDEVPPEYLLDYLTSGSTTGAAIAELAQYLRGRLPGPAVTSEQLRSRTWWSGADVFVVVDDYDLVATGAGSPLQPLVELLPHARDIGLHVALTRRSGGAARALFEPMLQTLRDLAAPVFVLSGNPDEGPLVGSVRPRTMPPGRATLVTREEGSRLVQLAWTPPVTM